jgi:hypothetical protein
MSGINADHRLGLVGLFFAINLPTFLSAFKRRWSTLFEIISVNHFFRDVVQVPLLLVRSSRQGPSASISTEYQNSIIRIPARSSFGD